MKQKLPQLYFFCLIVGLAISYGATGQVFPLKISANKRYLVDQQEKPCPILGRTAWFIISLKADQYQQFISNTIAKGYNAIEMSAINHDPRGNNAPYNGAGDLPFLKRLDGLDWKGELYNKDSTAVAPDFTTPNEKYWRYLDTFFAYCAARKLTVFIFPDYLGYAGGKEGWGQETILNGPAKMEVYGAFIAKRYKDQPNLVWMLLGDISKLTRPLADAEGRLIKGLKSIPGQLSNHYSAEANSGQNSTDQVDFGNQMTLNGVYDWGGKLAPLGRKAYSQKPVMPAYLLEEPYDEEGPDGNKVNPSAIQPVRRFQWTGWLSTIGGYISGNGYIWGFRTPDWQQHLDTKGAREMALINSFIKTIPWWELVPSGLDGMNTLVTSGGGMPADADYVAAAANPAGTLLVAYLPPAHDGSIEVDLTVMRNRSSGWWFDPTNGNIMPVQGSPFDNKGKKQFRPPALNQDGAEDWVLLLKTNPD